VPGMKDGKPIGERVLMAVLFDPKSGHIAHYHRVHLFDPNRQISQTHVEQRARELAIRHGWDIAKLETISVDASKLKPGAKYIVDVKSRSMVETEERMAKRPASPLRLQS
jgi:bifunctional ADP-heptose synthase (sugar kinase/adenylyltransferase)